MQAWAEAFYKSKAWQHTRRSYLQKIGGLCERCLKRGLVRPAVIVHHKIYLDPIKIQDPKISLNYDNLEALCRDCHAAEHNSGRDRRYKIDEYGRVKIL